MLLELIVTILCNADNLRALNGSVQSDVSRIKTVISSNTTARNPRTLLPLLNIHFKFFGLKLRAAFTQSRLEMIAV